MQVPSKMRGNATSVKRAATSHTVLQKKYAKMVFCYIFYKTWLIMIKSNKMVSKPTELSLQ